MEFLSTKFVEEYVDSHPKPLTELGEFVYYRTYSRWLENKGRREYWHETVKRAIEYNMALAYKRLKDIGFKINLKEMRDEAKDLFVSIYETKQFPSGRTLWLGNANEVVNKDFALGNFNCSFLNISNWEDLGDLFYLLMVGTGVGFKSTKKLASRMDKIRVNTVLLHSEYKPVPVEQRLENTKVVKMENGFAKIYVGDSKDGWVDALREYFNLLTKKENEDIHTIKISYNSVRPKGERLKTFGGTASGHVPLMEMFQGINKVLKNEIDTYLEPIEADEKGYGQVRPVHVLDIGNLIGANVVVGGVRRTAEIFLFDADDYESMFAKYGINGIWTTEQLKQHHNLGNLLDKQGIKPVWFDRFTKYAENNVYLQERVYPALNEPDITDEKRAELNEQAKHYNSLIEKYNVRAGFDHRRMSNNSIAFEKKPTRESLHIVFEMLQGEGEPGFINLEEARRRRPNAEGINPCAEILLDSYGVCNLTTINIKAFIIEDGMGGYALDYEGLYEAQRMSTRIGVRMTLGTLELPHWDKVQQRDHLIGTSVTGWQDAKEMVGLSDKLEEVLMEELRKVSREEADRYASELRIPSPLLATTVKPEGTLSQVAGGVSAGVHMSHAPYYIRRIRINSTDPLVQVAKELGWVIHAEVGTLGHMDEDKLALPEVIAEARTLVVDFPVESGATRTKADTTVKEQLDTYFRFQKHYTEHNSSNTIDVKPSEWGEAEEIIYSNFDDFVGVSFLSHDGGTYKLAPYEAITKEEYEERKAKMKPFDAMLLRKYEESETEKDLENMESCESGVCPII